MNSRLLAVGSIVALCAACSAPISQQAGQELAAPVNCATAQGDLRALQSEKASVAKEIANGVSSIVPISLVVNLATGQEKERFEVGTNEYNQMIDKKIAQIKAQCGIQ